MTGTTTGWAGERSDRHGAVRFGGSSAGAGVGHDRVAKLLGAWYEASSEATGHGYADWFVPVTIEVVELILTLEDVDAALVSLGAARAHRGYTEIDALTDLAVLAEVLPARLRDRAEAPEASAAVAAGFESVDSASFPPAPPILGREAFAEAVDDDHLRVDERRPAETFAAVVTDVSGPDPGGNVPGVAVHVTAAEIELHFPLSDYLFWLRGGRFAVLVWRHPGLAQTVAQLERALSSRSELEASDANVWIEPVPATMPDPTAWVDRLAEAAPPRRDARDLRMASLLVDTPRSVEPAEGSHRAVRWVKNAQDVWNQSLSLVAAALAVVVLAAGLARAVGPRADGRGNDTVTFNAVSGPVVRDDPSPGRSVAVATAPLAPVSGVAVEEEPPVPASAQPVSHVEDAPAASANRPKPAPDPKPDPKPDPEAEQPEAASQSDPCAGLERGRAVACERRQKVKRSDKRGDDADHRGHRRTQKRRVRAASSGDDDRDDRGDRARRRRVSNRDDDDDDRRGRRGRRARRDRND